MVYRSLTPLSIGFHRHAVPVPEGLEIPQGLSLNSEVPDVLHSELQADLPRINNPHIQTVVILHALCYLLESELSFSLCETPGILHIFPKDPVMCSVTLLCGQFAMAYYVAKCALVDRNYTEREYW